MLIWVAWNYIVVQVGLKCAKIHLASACRVLGAKACATTPKSTDFKIHFVVDHAFDPSTEEAEAGGVCSIMMIYRENSRRGKPGLHSEILPILIKQKSSLCLDFIARPYLS